MRLIKANEIIVIKQPIPNIYMSQSMLKLLTLVDGNSELVTLKLSENEGVSLNVLPNRPMKMKMRNSTVIGIPGTIISKEKRNERQKFGSSFHLNMSRQNEAIVVSMRSGAKNIPIVHTIP